MPKDVAAQQDFTGATLELAQVKAGRCQLETLVVPGEDLGSGDEQVTPADLGDQAGHGRVVVLAQAHDDVAEPAKGLPGRVHRGAAQQCGQQQGAGEPGRKSGLGVCRVGHGAHPRRSWVVVGRSVAEGELDDLDHDQRGGEEQVAAQDSQSGTSPRTEGGSGQHRQRGHPPGGPVEGRLGGSGGLRLFVVPPGPGEVGAGDQRQDRSARKDAEDLGGGDLREQHAGRQDGREHHQDCDHRAAEHVHATSVHPRSEHSAVVAQQEQEHGGRGEQDPSESLHAFGQQPQRAARDDDDHRGGQQQAGEDGVEGLGLRGPTVQGVAQAQDVTERVGGGQPDGCGADDRGVDQGDREQHPSPVPGVGSQAFGHTQRVGVVAFPCGTGKRRCGEGHHRCGTNYHEDDAEPQVDPLVADEPWGDPLVDDVGLLEEQLPRCDGRADDRDDQQHDGGQLGACGQAWNQEVARELARGRMDRQEDGDQGEGAGDQDQADPLEPAERPGRDRSDDQHSCGDDPWDLGLPKVPGVIAAAVLVIASVSTGSFRRFERVSLVLVAGSFTLIPIFLAVHPPASQLARDFLVPGLPAGSQLSTVMLLIIAIVGTTVAPWQLFFQQSYIIDKRITPRFIRYERVDLWLGIMFVIVGAAAMMAFSAAAFAGTAGEGNYTDALGVAEGLAAHAGHWAGVLFAIALIDASIIGAAAVGLSTSYALGDVLGLRHSLHRRPSEAKAFYAIFAGLLLASAVIVIIPGSPLGLLTEGVQTLAGVLLPSATVFLLLLCNDRGVLGPWVNGRGMNVFSGAVIAVLVMLSTILTAGVLFPQITSAQILGILAGGTVLTLIAGAYLAWAGRHHEETKAARAAEPTLDRATWRMPPLAMLTRPTLSAGSRTGLTVLRGYLLLASALVVVKVVQLALGH